MNQMIKGILFKEQTTTGTTTSTPSFDIELFKSTAQGLINPITTAALWIIPILGGCVILWQGIMWLQKDDDEKEQKPFRKTLKRDMMWIIGLELVPVLFKIFGL